MKKSLSQFCLIGLLFIGLSSITQAASFFDEFKAGKITLEQAIEKGKKLNIPLEDIIRILIANSPSSVQISEIVKATAKGESKETVQAIVLAAIGTLISGSGVGVIKDKQTLEIIAQIQTAAKDVTTNVDDVIDKSANAAIDSGSVIPDNPTSPN